MMDFIKADFAKGQEAERNGGKYEPDYDGCIKISTDASLKKMIAPGALVLGSPLLAGFLFGPSATAGLLAGAIVSGVQVAISASNTGGAWDNAKKAIEAERSQHRKELANEGINIDELKAEYAQHEKTGPGEDPHLKQVFTWVKADNRIRELHVAAVVGDTVGDPLKDTSGPAINILIKLSAITSLVFGNYIKGNNLAALLRADPAKTPDTPKVKAPENNGMFM